MKGDVINVVKKVNNKTGEVTYTATGWDKVETDLVSKFEGKGYSIMNESTDDGGDITEITYTMFKNNDDRELLLG